MFESLMGSIGQTFGNIMPHEFCVPCFLTGVAKGLGVGLLVLGAIASAPAWLATGLVIGIAAVGVVGLVSLASNWKNMSDSQKSEAMGMFVGGALVGGEGEAGVEAAASSEAAEAAAGDIAAVDSVMSDVAAESGLEPIEPATIPEEMVGPKGARGHSSGREFNADAAGGPITPKTTEGVTIDHGGTDTVEQHVSRFGSDSFNEAMISRLRAIADGKLEPTAEDLNFYTHEIDEFQRYKNIGLETGLPDDPNAQAELWNNTHTAALEDYGLADVVDGRSTLYHPECDPRTLPADWTAPGGWPFASGSKE
jgi:hypothetical protein